MKINHIVAILTVVGLGCSSAAFAQQEETQLERARRLDAAFQRAAIARAAVYVPQAKRPVILPVLYASLGAMQSWDIYSTSSALKAGAKEANPVAGNFGSMIGLKAATTAGTIFFAERMWKKNKVAAIAMLAGLNGATAAISMHNMRNAHVAGAR